MICAQDKMEKATLDNCARCTLSHLVDNIRPCRENFCHLSSACCDHWDLEIP